MITFIAVRKRRKIIRRRILKLNLSFVNRNRLTEFGLKPNLRRNRLFHENWFGSITNVVDDTLIESHVSIEDRELNFESFPFVLQSHILS